jgi:hypothetical protein
MTPNQLRATLAHEWRIRQEGRSRRLTSRIDSLGSCALYLRTGGGHELVQATGVRTEMPFIVSWKLVTITAERAKELKDLLESERVGELGLRYRSRRSADWLKMKNPACEAVKREAEEDWS